MESDLCDEISQAEKKAAAMRREARARILRKRAESSAKKDVGKAARVIARVKRDCRVTDPRRQKLGSRLFQGERTMELQKVPIGLLR